MWSFDSARFDCRHAEVTGAARAKKRKSNWHLFSGGRADALIGDPDRLRRIVVNLVGNAIKFTERGKWCYAAIWNRKRKTTFLLHFSVTDTGIGIPVEKQQRIFEAFAQADTSTTRKYGGTGLGLAISAHFGELMGGGDVGGKRGGTGKHVPFYGALRAAGSVPRKSGGTAPVKLQDLPVLVVDDNATSRQILEEMIGNWRMKPVTARTGRRRSKLCGAHTRMAIHFDWCCWTRTCREWTGSTWLRK